MDDFSCRIFAHVLAALWGGFGLFALVRFVMRSPHGRALAGRLRRAGPLSQAATLVLLAVAVAVGGSKPGGGNQQRTAPNTRTGNASASSAAGEPGFGLVEVRTNGVALRAEPTNAVEAAAWRLRGASEDGFWIERDEPFFALGTNPVRRVHAAASGALSFADARRPPLGAALPDGTALPALAPLRAPLGILPAANETNAAPSRFWHAPAPGGGLLLAWENVLVDRRPGRRATVQAELTPSGDFTYRYDFADALDPPATNLVIGAQAGTNGVNALAVLGTNVLAETVWRVDGARVTNGVSVADLLCTNGALRTPARFALEWRNVADVGAGDSDGDGLSDWDEVFIHGTDPHRADTDGDGISDGAEVFVGADPLDADEDDDGIPDGVDPAAWRAHRLWAEDPATADWTIHLDEAVPAGVRATLTVADLALPLRAATNYALNLPPGERLDVRLFSTGEDPLPLRLSPAPRAAHPSRGGEGGGLRSGGAGGAPRWRFDPAGVLDGDAARGRAAVAQPMAALVPVEAAASDCLHDGEGHRDYRFAVAPAGTGIGLGDAALDNLEPVGGDVVRLEVVGTEPGASETGTATVTNGLDHGEVSAAVSIHRCLGEGERWCEWCRMVHGPGEACWHEEDCPALTNDLSDCTCPPLVIRVSSLFDERETELSLVGSSSCCCPSEDDAIGAEFVSASANLTVRNAAGRRLSAGDDATGVLTVSGEAVSGVGPSEIQYDLLVPGRNAQDEPVTNRLSRTRKVWVVDILFEPVNTNEVNGFVVNPCGVMRGQTAHFRLHVDPQAFPDSGIVWHATPQSAFVPPDGGWTGREVAAVATNVSADVDATFSAAITGYGGPPPTTNVRVLAAETVIPIHAWIVCSTNGPVTDVGTVRDRVAGANEIYRQVGRRFVLQEPVGITVTNQSWAEIELNQAGTSWPAFDELVDTHHVVNGVEVYFVLSIEEANGLTNPGGCAVRASAGPNSLAHELGHAQGLPDIYAGGVTNMPAVTGKVSQSRLPDDWGTSSSEGYYPTSLMQAELIERTLMYGVCSPTKRDITTGDVRSIWKPNFSFELPRESNAPIGFFQHALPNPHSN